MPTHRGHDGTQLHHDVLGAVDGPPLVLLAGGAARHPQYLGDLAGLGGRHRLVVPHLRGVGRSADAPLGEAATRWRQVDDLELLRADLGLERMTIVGHSAGTRLAIAYAARHPHSTPAGAATTSPRTSPS